MNVVLLFPEAAQREMRALEKDIAQMYQEFEPRREPWHLCALVLVWCVREIVKMRREPGP